MIWCPTVSTGAFVARRNGKVFITGNSGFPKSLDVSKAIDKAAGAERDVIGVAGKSGSVRNSMAGNFAVNRRGENVQLVTRLFAHLMQPETLRGPVGQYAYDHQHQQRDRHAQRAVRPRQCNRDRLGIAGWIGHDNSGETVRPL